MSAKNAQNRILDAFCRLLQKRHFDQIAVSHITKEANVGRTTFYNYFNDKYELIEALERIVLEDIYGELQVLRTLDFETVTNCLTGDELLVGYFLQLQKNIDVLRILVAQDPYTNFLRRFDTANIKWFAKTLQIWNVPDTSSLLGQCWTRVLSRIGLELSLTFVRQYPSHSAEEMATFTSAIYLGLLLHVHRPAANGAAIAQSSAVPFPLMTPPHWDFGMAEHLL
ncbi:TetR/AcrR family transcriptional regulator [Ruminococcaceae bacterium OttesenSCG-928-O06]|nr:TetR/AcrR family transcriptional regulator [Ruminococcaceae bacterium OttesenSCG-928-O06]